MYINKFTKGAKGFSGSLGLKDFQVVGMTPVSAITFVTYKYLQCMYIVIQCFFPMNSFSTFMGVIHW